MADFVQEYFINPILANGYFNPVNTLVYGIILVFAVLGVYKLMQRMKVKIDKHFFYAVLPFIFWGSSTRVLHDAAYQGKLAAEALNAFYVQPFFPTPGSYFITFGLAIAVLFISLGIQKMHKKPYWKTMAITGIALDVLNVLLIPYVTVLPLLMILTITAFWMLLFYLIYRIGSIYKSLKKIKIYLSHVNQLILGAHFLDASATFTAMSFFGYGEQHVVPNILIPMLGPAAMFLLKIVVVLPVLWIVDRYGEKGEFNNFLKIVILILGLAPALRNLLRLLAMV